MGLRALAIDPTPLRSSRDFRLLWFGHAISFTGSVITTVALPWEVFTLTHSSLAVGLLGLAELVPLLVLSIVGGAVADTVARRALFLGPGNALGPGAPAPAPPAVPVAAPRDRHGRVLACPGPACGPGQPRVAALPPRWHRQRAHGGPLRSPPFDGAAAAPTRTATGRVRADGCLRQLRDDVRPGR